MFATSGAAPILDNTIIAFCGAGEAVLCDIEGPPSDPVLSCCDVYGNEGGDWVGCIESQFGVNGNFAGDPAFCDSGNGDFTICESSPCAPAQQPDCGLIGALGVGCGPTATQLSTWGLVKSLFELPGGR